jgi:pimeloyl-ACP methyl ester carboxylesterase
MFKGLGKMEQQHWCDHLVGFTAEVDDIIIGTLNPAWKDIPILYLICDEDLLIPDNLQRSVIDAGRHSGANVDETLLEGCGHAPNLSAPAGIVVVLQAAASKFGSAEQRHPLSSGSNSTIVKDAN